MPTSFTSYWGSPVHGAEITWTHDTSADSLTLAFSYTANYYWRMPVYYSSTDTDGDAAYVGSLGADATFYDNSSGCSGSTDCCADNTGGTTYDYTVQMWSRFIIADPSDSSNWDGFNGL